MAYKRVALVFLFSLFRISFSDGWMLRVHLSLNFSASDAGVDASRPPSVPSTLLHRGYSIEAWLNKLGFGFRTDQSPAMDSYAIPQGPDDDIPAPGQQFAQFGAGCFWGIELAYQRVAGATKTEVGYSQGYVHNPRYEYKCLWLVVDQQKAWKNDAQTKKG
ncbi:PREDICTED: peptide methionine sulfoxide reductase-like [Nicotiana attenuata]|uniref:peptide methionine sulfoxide reductase-like n=1 Tax=Nicotiana attenuata TaxID=49451 RepID=UPI000905B8BE|nr:PREDICTED: peptide methionine sulfoxide reductase-like [Nicotiana attenuata]